MSDPYSRFGTAVRHRSAGVMVNIEVGEVVLGGQVRWYADLVLAKGRRLRLPGGALPAGSRLADRALMTAVSDQAQAVDGQIILAGLRPQADQTGDLF